MSFYIVNRYSPGSPAMIDRETAIRVATDERECFDHALTGVYGPDAQARAEQLGLRGIVYQTSDRGNLRTIKDLITNEEIELTSSERLLIGAMRYATSTRIVDGCVYLYKPKQAQPEKFTFARYLFSLVQKEVAIKLEDESYKLAGWIAESRI